MNAMDLLETIGGIRDAYVVAAHSARKQRRMPRKRMLLIAAIIAVACCWRAARLPTLPGGCAWA